ncbi:MAG TPA: iron ABC transporter permease [Casimicrobiaceae bacterium]|nr:iron ABC transporter permease [Casimicrobiaceae bacterium]
MASVARPSIVATLAARDLRIIAVWLAVGAAGFALLPWFMLQDNVLSFAWIRRFAARNEAPGLVQAAVHGRWWLWPIGGLLLAGAATMLPMLSRRHRSSLLIGVGTLGFVYTLVQGFAIDARGYTWPGLERLFGPLAGGQYGWGLGAALVVASFVMLFASGLAQRGYFKGDGFVAGSVVGIAALIGFFTFFPVAKILLSAVQPAEGNVALSAFSARLFTEKIWGLGCLGGGTRCGVAWNTLMLALSSAVLCTGLGLAFALLVTRTNLPFRRVLRVLSVLPIITPPFVIGLGLILLFGRSGLVNQFLELAFGIEPTRWIYGFQGVLLAQVFAFTPIAFLVLIGVVEGVSPTLEEAAQTLRADRWTTFATVSLPLMRPGLANAFLISFIESIADFGNPIVLGGNFGVLSTEIFFSVVGAQLDQGRAATLGLVLLTFALAAFLLQRSVVGRRAYTTMSGKGDAGLPTPLPQRVSVLCGLVAFPWALLTVVIYAMALAGGFVETWGRDYTPTLKHYVKAFGVESSPNGLIWSGAAWNSFWTTVKLSAIAAPLTAALGILAAWLLTRQRFVGQRVFEFGTMLSFAIPGTVIGVSYILAFNVPPIELTGTAIILVVCNVFRNMPVGVRAGMASMAQVDASLDEAANTLRARGFATLRTVLLPLLKPAIVGALVYSFVRAMTTVSAVIFLVSAEYEWATTYIINRVVNGDYGVAIAYCSVLIAMMVVVILLIQRLVGERRLGRRTRLPAPRDELAASSA